jgi:hypothetical protein
MDGDYVRSIGEYNIPDCLQLAYGGLMSSCLPRVRQCANVVTEHRGEDVTEAILSPSWKVNIGKSGVTRWRGCILNGHRVLQPIGRSIGYNDKSPVGGCREYRLTPQK